MNYFAQDMKKKIHIPHMNKHALTIIKLTLSLRIKNKFKENKFSSLCIYFFRFILALNVEDQTGNTTFFAFGSYAENLTDTTIHKLSLLGHNDRFIVPKFIKNKVIGKFFLFDISPMKKTRHPEDISFRINSSHILEDESTSSTTLLLPVTSSSQASLETTRDETTKEAT